MKKQCLIVFATVAITVIGLGSLASVQGSDIVVSRPGITVVQDAKDDLLLRRCNSDYPGISCSLPPPPAAPLPTLPGYFDIKTAKINQLDKKWVELSIALYAPIPAELPDWAWHLVYFWQFAGGCVEDSTVDKAGVSVLWNGSTWAANWYVIEACEPERIIVPGDPVPFQFTKDGVKVRVRLDDLIEGAIEPGGKLEWHAGVRRIPFIWEPFDHTTAVDYAPDVFEFLPPPIYIGYPEDFATWEPR